MPGEERRPAPRRRAILPLLLAAGLGVAVAWLLAERNARQWWIVPEGGKVVVNDLGGSAEGEPERRAPAGWGVRPVPGRSR